MRAACSACCCCLHCFSQHTTSASRAGGFDDRGDQPALWRWWQRGVVYQADYVELFNRGTTLIGLSEWSIQYASASDTGLFSASVTPLAGTIAPRQSYLVQLNSAGRPSNKKATWNIHVAYRS